MMAHPFTGRRQIDGQIKLETALALMSGEAETGWGVAVQEGEEAPQVALVARGAGGAPYIPGASLKGALRAWAVAHLAVADDTIWRLFGCEPRVLASGVQQARGGKLEFWDAFATSGSLPVRGATRIERATRTAALGKLRHFELVPKGTEFAVCITADCMDDGEQAVILAALEGFNAPDAPIALGKAKGSGFGRASWFCSASRTMDGNAIKEWCKPGTADGWRERLTGLAADSSPVIGIAHKAPLPEISVRLRLVFDGPFLVSEAVPDAERLADWREASWPEPPSRDQSAPGVPNRRPLCEPASAAQDVWEPLLPGSSVRGALRSQTERIWRTVSAKELDEEGKCGGETAISRIFGRTGRRGLLTIGDFELCADVKKAQQDFVAIDRFTGGAKDSAKFLIETALAPVYEGTVSVCVRGPAHADASGKRGSGEAERRLESADLGLLALLLRDLIEGDISFGFGRSKGFGTCRAEICALRWSALPAEICAPAAARSGAWKAGDVISEPLKAAVNAAAHAFSEGCRHD